MSSPLPGSSSTLSADGTSCPLTPSNSQSARSAQLTPAVARMSEHKSKSETEYLFTFEFFPWVVLELEIELLQIFGIGEVDKTVSNIALVLRDKEGTLRSQGR